MVRIRPVTADNWLEAIALHVKPHQERFVPTVTLSLAKAYIKPNGVHYDPWGIYHDEMIVGFYSFMYKPHDTRVCYIGGFLIDARYQGQGYGTMAMEHFLQWLPDRLPNCEGIYLTVHPDNVAAARFYQQFGFSKTGLVIDGEDAMGLTFAQERPLSPSGGRRPENLTPIV